jgi:outer membrane biogenesis lipoprotein LolB
MKNHPSLCIRGLLLAICCTLGVTACAVFRPAPQEALPPGAGELPALLLQRAAYWQSYQAQLTIRLQTPQGKFRVQATLLAKPPEWLRLEATNLGGQTIWVLTFNPQNATLWLPAEKVIYQAKRGETILNHFLGTPIPTEVFAYSFIGCIPPDQVGSARFRLTQERSKLVGRFQDRDFKWRFSWALLASPPALQGLKAEETPTEESYAIRFEPAIDLQPTSKPDKVLISSKQWQLEAIIKQMQKPEQLPPALFSLPPVPGTRVVNL